MDYSFKINLLKKPVTLRLAGFVMEILDENQEQSRQIELSRIRKFREYDGLTGHDPNKGSYKIRYCKLYVSGESGLCIRNGIFLGTQGRMGDVSTDQTAEYNAFLSELKRSVARTNPNVSVISGSLLASLAWWFNSLLGVGLLAFGVGGFFMDKLVTALLIALFSFPVGGLLSFLGFTMGKGYWPSRISVVESLDNYSEEG